MQQLTHEEGMYSGNFFRRRQTLPADIHGPLTSQRMSLCTVGGRAIRVAARDEVAEYGLRAPNFWSSKRRDGTTPYGVYLLDLLQWPKFRLS